MTIHDADLFVKGLWDWSILDGCFGDTHIRPTDCEGFVERNHRFLYLETKSVGAAIPYGQHLMFNHMRETGLFTVIVVWGSTNCPVKAKVYTRHHVTEILNCDLAQFRALVQRWFIYAERAPNYK